MPTVNIPMFFRLRKSGKTSYLLGSMHALSLKELPHQVLEIIETCKNMVTEKTQIQGDLDHFIQAMKRPPYSEPWADKLPYETKIWIEEVIAQGFQYFSDYLESPYKLQELEIWAAYFMISVMEPSLYNSVVNEQDTMGMDEELGLRFSSAHALHGLEGYMDRIPNYKLEAGNINDLIDCHKRFLSLKLDSSEKPSDTEDAEDKRIRELGGHAAAYRSGEILFDMQLARLATEDTDLNHRNFNWLPKMLEYHANLRGPVLFCVGCMHLIGNTGLLSLLKRNGFDISFLGPNDFKPYTYPFTEDYQRKTLTWMREIIEKRKQEWKIDQKSIDHKSHDGFLGQFPSV
jgi:hypothetical protein